MRFRRKQNAPVQSGRVPENGASEVQDPMSPALSALLMRGDAEPMVGAMETDEPAVKIDRKAVSHAISELTRYKQGKTNFETRVVEDELWWELRHWEAIRKNKSDADHSPEPSSAWLFNAILNKHADAMDNYPEPLVLPRERSDEESAKTLSEVLPVVLEYNDFEQVYSDNWWEKLKHGTAAYGVFWNNKKDNGLGDIDIRAIDLLNIFWEPGITDLQDSRNLFIVGLVDEDILDEQYPEHAGKLGGSVVDVKEYIYDDTVDVSQKSVVVDWYYKRQLPGGGEVLHYAKFVGDTLLFASENDPQYSADGWYAHGKYPVVLDVLFPEKGTPMGFGYVAISKDPQLYIDKLSANILETSSMATKKRFFVSQNTGVNEEEFLDWSKPLVHVEGELDDRRIQEIVMQPISGVYVDVVNMKIEEMKDTVANRDVNSGSAGSGVTAAAAIAALQEAGNKASRDMIAGSYRAYVHIDTLCLELMRQFYDETRSFRVTGGTAGQHQFVEVNNTLLRDQPMVPAYPGQEMEPGYVPIYRKPVFDIKINAQKKNPFSRMEQNERAKELYAMGFFNPERAQEAMGALDMMEFEGIDKVRERVEQGQTLINQMQQMAMQLQQLMGIVAALQGQTMPGVHPEQSQGSQTQQVPSGGNPMAQSAMQAQTPMTGYGQALAQRSTPSMDASSNAATPKS